MTIGNGVLIFISLGSILVIASHSMEAKKMKDECNAYLSSIRERSKQ